MLEKTRGIILHTVKYGDTSLILTVYTEKFGRQAFLINAVRNSKSKIKAGILQPLFIVDLEVYEKKTREVQRIREAKVAYPYISIPFDIIKTTQAIFLSEVLFRVLQEEESNQSLFHFLEGTLLFFDLMEKEKSLFYIWFLVHLTGYLGIVPDIQSVQEGWLDMQKGILVSSEPLHTQFMDRNTTMKLKQMLQIQLQDLEGFSLTREERQILVKNILEYYHLHFNNMVNLKSLEILREVFH